MCCFREKTGKRGEVVWFREICVFTVDSMLVFAVCTRVVVVVVRGSGSSSRGRAENL